MTQNSVSKISNQFKVHWFWHSDQWPFQQKNVPSGPVPRVGSALVADC